MKKKKKIITEEQVLEYIYGYESDNGIVPSTYQIAEVLRCSHQNLEKYLKRLIEKGRLRKVERRSYGLPIDNINK